VSWDGRDDLGKKLANGLYFLRLIAANANAKAEFVQVRKMLLTE